MNMILFVSDSNYFMCLMIEFALGKYVLKHCIPHVVHVEAETVCSWIELSSFRGYHAIIGS